MNNTSRITISVLSIALLGGCGGGSKSKKQGSNEFSGAAAKAHDQCPNPIEVKTQDGEQQIAMADLVNGAEGSYELVSSEIYVEVALKDGSASVLHGEGEREGERAKVVCHSSATIRYKTLRIRVSLVGEMDFPVSINTRTGESTRNRASIFRVRNGVPTASTKEYAKIHKIDKQDPPVPGNTKVVIGRKADGSVSMRLKMSEAGRDGVRTVYVRTVSMVGNYRLKSAPASAAPTGSK